MGRQLCILLPFLPLSENFLFMTDDSGQFGGQKRADNKGDADEIPGGNKTAQPF